MAVLDPVQEEVPADWVLDIEQIANSLYEIKTRLVRIIRYSQAARSTLAEAANLLDEETDAAEILVADMFSLTVDGGDCLNEVSIHATAKLVASIFSGVPALQGAVSTARDLVASVLAVSQMVVGPLHVSLSNMQVAINCHESARFAFFICAPHMLVQQHVWSKWMLWMDFAIQQEVQANLFLEKAIQDAKAVEESMQRLYLAVSLEQQKEHMVRAKQILHNAIEAINNALIALAETIIGINSEELVVRQAIYYALAPAVHDYLPGFQLIRLMGVHFVGAMIESSMSSCKKTARPKLVVAVHQPSKRFWLSPFGIFGRRGTTQGTIPLSHTHAKLSRMWWVGDQLAMVHFSTQEARASLAEAARLLNEDIDAAEIVFTHSLSVILARGGDPGTLTAVGRLVHTIFFLEKPVLRGAISAAMDLVVSVHVEAETRLSSAISEAQRARRVYGILRAQSRRREVFLEVGQILRVAIQEVDAALVAIQQMLDAVAAEERIVRNLITVSAL
uniref:Uncharacterized protein n=1 Tax=Leersia perrieri TaxID=77586 RepID=A0A0D9VVC2_9ORYZ